MIVRLFEGRDQDEARRVVLEGLGEHFGFIDGSLNPDLDDIEGSFLLAGHVFLVAESDGAVVGTGGLLLVARRLSFCMGIRLRLICGGM